MGRPDADHSSSYESQTEYELQPQEYESNQEATHIPDGHLAANYQNDQQNQQYQPQQQVQPQLQQPQPFQQQNLQPQQQPTFQPQQFQPQQAPPQAWQQPAQYPPAQPNQAYPPQKPAKYPPPQPNQAYPQQPAQYPPQPVQFPPRSPATAHMNANVSPPVMPQTGHAPQASPQAFPQPGYIPPQRYDQGMPPASPHKPAAGIPVAGGNGWRTGLFDFMDDPMNALVTCFFPCLTFGQVAEIVDDGHTSCGTSGMLYGAIGFLIGMPCLLSCTYRTKLRNKFGLPEAPAPDWVTHFLCEACALCQAYRELQLRGWDPSIGWQGNLARQNMQPAPVMMAPMNQRMMS